MDCTRVDCTLRHHSLEVASGALFDAGTSEGTALVNQIAVKGLFDMTATRWLVEYSSAY